MYILCPNCKQKQWLDTRRQCESCGHILRRCADCVNYKAVGQKCVAKGIELDPHEAEHPGALAVSALCPGYSPATATAI